jgi:hypothetical protein
VKIGGSFAVGLSLTKCRKLRIMINLTIKGILKPIIARCYGPVLSVYNTQNSNEMFIHFPELDGT